MGLRTLLLSRHTSSREERDILCASINFRSTMCKRTTEPPTHHFKVTIPSISSSISSGVPPKTEITRGMWFLNTTVNLLVSIKSTTVDRVTNLWRTRELQDQRLPNPNTLHLGYDWVKPPVKTHGRLYFGLPKSSSMGQPRTHHVFEPFGHFDPCLDPGLDPIHERRSDLKGDRLNHNTFYTDRKQRHHHEPIGHDRDQCLPPIFNLELHYSQHFDRGFDQKPCRFQRFDRNSNHKLHHPQRQDSWTIAKDIPLAWVEASAPIYPSKTLGSQCKVQGTG
uniref:Uncharacterized protein n=1 Tax=Fagus sylvatica TaxID=28930 RepID=A0A2N9HVF6_FAGSY